MTQVTEIVCFFDPVRCQIDFYPKIFSQKIELAFASKSDDCVGKSFFQCDRAFRCERNVSTTPGEYFGRSFKQPGYRTVARWSCTVARGEKDLDAIQVFGRRIHGEWRLCKEEDAERTFQVAIPEECVIDHQTTADSNPRLWTLETRKACLTPPWLYGSGARRLICRFTVCQTTCGVRGACPHAAHITMFSHENLWCSQISSWKQYENRRSFWKRSIICRNYVGKTTFDNIFAN